MPPEAKTAALRSYTSKALDLELKGIGLQRIGSIRLEFVVLRIEASSVVAQPGSVSISHWG